METSIESAPKIRNFKSPQKESVLLNIKKTILDEFKKSDSLSLAGLKRTHHEQLMKLGYTKNVAEGEIKLIVEEFKDQAYIELIGSAALPHYRITPQGMKAEISNHSAKIPAPNGQTLDKKILSLISSGEIFTTKKIAESLYQSDYNLSKSSFTRNICNAIKRLNQKNLVVCSEERTGKAKNLTVQLTKPEGTQISNLNNNLSKPSDILSSLKRKEPEQAVQASAKKQKSEQIIINKCQYGKREATVTAHYEKHPNLPIRMMISIRNKNLHNSNNTEQSIQPTQDINRFTS